MRTLRARTTANTAKFLSIVAALLFLSAGTLRFWQAWLYLALNLAWLTLAGAYFLKRDPALVERRLTQDERGEREPLQRRIMSTFRALGAITLVLTGLDHRFGWSALPTWLVAGGGVLFVAGVAVVFAVFAENTYTSSIIEVDAGQTVVATGPYRVLRHPMYAGTLLMGLGTPLILGSLASLILLPPGWALLAVRILAEERFLADRLRGYAEYMRRTPTRLIPGLW
jgi:protein-S-isoprenylcysteine O-methyltransferase Ste14